MILHNLGSQNTVLNQFINEIRDVNIQKDTMRFRRNIERIGEVLSYELSKTLDYEDKVVQTPLGSKGMTLPKGELVLCSILRAGIPF